MNIENLINELYAEEQKSREIFMEKFADKDISKKHHSEYKIDDQYIYINNYKSEYEDIYQKTFAAIKNNYDSIKRKTAKIILNEIKKYNKENEDSKIEILPESEIYKNLTINSNYKNKKIDPYKISKKYPSFIVYRKDYPVNIHLNFYNIPITTFEIYYIYYPDKNKLEFDDYLAQY